ncbi:hypothetical protein [Sphingobium lignivorans]|uniref:DUF4375 domain-containing protein n=1 Tax=Sphingobium lignivorans TaxID=2735886 RepID=A0ABR6NFD7_9SPHN|nr:hypothetical protein [Sphingobium lignivorans]MBB5985993.1 hypothetical protein [Sphingobium lignivorans]
MQLTEKRKADRAKMADILEALATEKGAKVTRPDSLHPREIRLKIEVEGGPYVHVEFDGSAPSPDYYDLTWNVDHGSLWAFSSAFGDVNAYHFTKASRAAKGFTALCNVIADDIETLLSGRGYCAERAMKRARDKIELERDGMDYAKSLVGAGQGTKWADGRECESPEQVRAAYEAMPGRIAKLEAFIAASAPREACTGFDW